MNNVNTAMWLFLLGLTQFGYSLCILTISVKGLVPCLSSWGRHALSISLHKLVVQREIRNAEMGSSNPSGLCSYSTCEGEGRISFNTNLHFPMQFVQSEQVGRDGQDNTIQPADLPQLCRKNVLRLQCKVALTSAKNSMQRGINCAC